MNWANSRSVVYRSGCGQCRYWKICVTGPGFTIHLAVADNANVIYIERMHGPRRFQTMAGISCCMDIPSPDRPPPKPGVATTRPVTSVRWPKRSTSPKCACMRSVGRARGPAGDERRPAPRAVTVDTRLPACGAGPGRPGPRAGRYCRDRRSRGTGRRLPITNRPDRRPRRRDRRATNIGGVLPARPAHHRTNRRRTRKKGIVGEPLRRHTRLTGPAQPSRNRAQHAVRVGGDGSHRRQPPPQSPDTRGGCTGQVGATQKLEHRANNQPAEAKPPSIVPVQIIRPRVH